MQAHLLHAPASHVRGPECARPDAHRAQQQATCLARAPSPAAPITNTPNRRQATPSTRCQAQAGSTVQALVREVEKRKLRPLPKVQPPLRRQQLQPRTLAPPELTLAVPHRTRRTLQTTPTCTTPCYGSSASVQGGWGCARPLR